MPEPVLYIIVPLLDHGAAVARKRNIFSAAAKLAVYSVMYGNFVDEKFPNGYITKLLRDLNLTRTTLHAIWTQGQDAVQLNVGVFLDDQANIQRFL
jgi:hypothetical protein